jgi:hypothetical protein
MRNNVLSDEILKEYLIPYIGKLWSAMPRNDEQEASLDGQESSLITKKRLPFVVEEAFFNTALTGCIFKYIQDKKIGSSLLSMDKHMFRYCSYQ